MHLPQLSKVEPTSDFPLPTSDFSGPPAAARVVAYIRGSTEDQQLTLDAQQATIEKYCAFKELSLEKVFIDSGTSAYKLPFREREVARELLEYAENRGIRQIAFAKLDRSFRNVRDCLTTVDTFMQAGIQMHFLDLQFDTSSVMGRFFLTVVAALAELENGIRSERQTAAFDAMRRQGQRRGGIPYGWAPVPAAGRESKTGRPAEDLVPVSEEQAALAHMRQMRARGVSYAKIAAWLNAEGIPSKAGSVWRPGVVHSVLAHAVAPSNESDPSDTSDLSDPSDNSSGLRSQVSSLSGLRSQVSGLPL